jgi:hypothetical protein
MVKPFRAQSTNYLRKEAEGLDAGAARVRVGVLVSDHDRIVSAGADAVNRAARHAGMTRLNGVPPGSAGRYSQHAEGGTQ